MSQQDLQVIAGNSTSIDFLLVDEVTLGVTEPADLTGVVVEVVVRAEIGSASPIVTYSTAAVPTPTVTIVDAPGGRVQVRFEAAHVGTVGRRVYHVDVIRDSRRLTYVRGQITTVPAGGADATYAGSPSVSTRDELRFRAGDTRQPFALLDFEVDFLLSENGDDPVAAVPAYLDALAARWGSEVDRRVGDVSVTASTRAKGAAERAASLATTSGAAVPRAKARGLARSSYFYEGVGEHPGTGSSRPLPKTGP